MIVQFPPARFNQNLSKVIPTTISKASFPSVTLNDRTQKIRRKLEEDALSESRGDFLQLTHLIVCDVLQISVLMWDIIPLSPVSTDWLMVPAITGNAHKYFELWECCFQLLWKNLAVFSMIWRRTFRCISFPQDDTNKRRLICGCVNNYRAPGSHNSSRISHTFVFPLHLQVLFFSSGSSGSLALSAAAPPVNYHISNFPPAQIRPLLPAWPSCLLWGGLSSSSLTVNR